MLGDLIPFLGVSAIVIVPGPDTVLTIRNTLGGGRRGGSLTALGVSAGQAVWALATSAGSHTSSAGRVSRVLKGEDWGFGTKAQV